MGKLRFDLLLILDLTTFLISTAANIWVLTHGFGVIALAVIALATDQLHNLLYLLLAKYLFPALNFSWRRFDSKSGWALASYSVWAFLIHAANQLRFRVDSLTTGALFGGEAITRYSIGGRLGTVRGESVGARVEHRPARADSTTCRRRSRADVGSCHVLAAVPPASSDLRRRLDNASRASIHHYLDGS